MSEKQLRVSGVERARVPAQQDRSRKTEAAILDAVRALLDGAPIDRITMSAIARAAQVSVGGVYARFPGGKTGLIHTLYRELLSQWSAALEGALPDDCAVKFEMADVVQRYVSVMVRSFFDDRPLLVAAHRMLATGKIDADLVREAQAFDQRVHTRFLDHATRALPSDVSEEEAQEVLRFALFQMSAAGRAAALDPRWSGSGPVRADRLIEEIVVGATAYLEVRLGHFRSR